jgi:hypothetical protein
VGHHHTLRRYTRQGSHSGLLPAAKKQYPTMIWVVDASSHLVLYEILRKLRVTMDQEESVLAQAMEIARSAALPYDPEKT